MRIQAEDGATHQGYGALLDHADVQVAVLHRPWKLTFLVRRAHNSVLSDWYVAPEDQDLGTPADAGVQRPYEHLVRSRLGQDHRPDFANAG